MGRIAELCGEIAEAADEGSEGLELPAEAWDRLREDWSDEDIEDALGVVRQTLNQEELVDAADSLSSHLIDVLGGLGDEASYARAVAGEVRISIQTIAGLARRVDRLEAVLAGYRETAPPDRRGFDALQQRLMNQGIEQAMRRSAPPAEDDES